jgi:predicted nucleic acid-binding protein
VIVDASVWVSYFLPRDRFHADTVSWLEGCLRAERDLSSPVLLLAELAGAVSRETGNAESGISAVDALGSIPSLTLLPLEGELTRLSAQVAASLRVRGADSIYIAAAEQLQLPLVTWDVEQRTRGSRLVRAVTPAELE